MLEKRKWPNFRQIGCQDNFNRRSKFGETGPKSSRSSSSSSSSNNNNMKIYYAHRANHYTLIGGVEVMMESEDCNKLGEWQGYVKYWQAKSDCQDLLDLYFTYWIPSVMYTGSVKAWSLWSVQLLLLLANNE